MASTIIYIILIAYFLICYFPYSDKGTPITKEPVFIIGTTVLLIALPLILILFEHVSWRIVAGIFIAIYSAIGIYLLKTKLFEGKAHKNIVRLRNKIENIIDKTTNNDRSCKTDVLETFDILFKNSREQAAKWNNDFNYDLMAYKTLYNISCDLLSSGKYHLTRGQLNPMNESNHLYAVILKCLDWYKEHGYITTEQCKEQLDILRENISMVG